MIHCLAVDDEQLSLELLEDNIRRIPFLHLAGRCSNAYQAMDIMLRQPVDLLFLDIQMGGISGTQFLQSIASMRNKPMVIFVTAYKKYALEGFELDVLDYLVKPVAFERFLKAVNKAAEYHALKNSHARAIAPAAGPAPENNVTVVPPPVADVQVSMPALGNEETGNPGPEGEVTSSVQLSGTYPEYFFVNVEYNLVKITVSDICFVEGLKDYIKIYLKGVEKPVMTRLPMKSIAEKLSPRRFVRVHKSYIVGVDKIDSIRKNRIYIHQHIIPVSDSYRDDLFSKISF